MKKPRRNESIGRVCRTLGILGLSIFLYSGCALAEGVAQEVAVPVDQAKWALEISEKELVEESTKLLVELTNTSQHLSVTAYGIAVIEYGPDGDGARSIRIRDFLPGEGMAPSTSKELTIELTRSPSSEGTPSFAAAQAFLLFEILSDTTSRGQQNHVEDVFRRRAIYLKTIEESLAKLHEAQNSLSDGEAVATFSRAYATRYQELERQLQHKSRVPSAPDRDRVRAVREVSQLGRQLERQVAAGWPPAEALQGLEGLLREDYLEPLFYGVRWQDSQWAVRQELEAPEICGKIPGVPDECFDKLQIESDCKLEKSGTKSSTYSHQCPVRVPTLTQSHDFTCTACNQPQGSGSISATGYGDCDDSRACNPKSNGFTWDDASVSLVIVNALWHTRSDGSKWCKDQGFTSSTESCDCPECGESHTPIIISLEDGELELTNAESGVLFDLDADELPESTAWTAPGSDEAFLTLDRNGNGRVDDGSELFGDATPQPARDPKDRNGFAALALFDDVLNGGNGDGWIDEYDEIFSSLRLWIDTNHNGLSEPEELTSLADEGVVAIHLDYWESGRKDRHGNTLRYTSRIDLRDRAGLAWDVYFRQLEERH